MSDCISRQAAIDAVHEEFDDCLVWDESGEHTADEVERILDRVPSAQPEIIRCKDCKHLQKWRSEESAKEFGQIYACTRNVFNCPKPEDFCSFAERRAEE